MRIHRLRVQDFRGIADREVVFALDGITIVEGPNEAGKTSLAEAIDLVLRVPDSSTARQVKDVAPVHRDVGPRVEIELETGPWHITYAKRWLKQRETTLEIHAPRREHLTGRDAHNRVEDILADTLDADLWAALRLEQGDALGQAAFDTPALARALDAATGGVEAGDREDDLFSRIRAERARYWTATGKPRAERVALERDVAAVAAQVDDLERRLGELDAHAERVADLTSRLDALRGAREPLAARLGTAEAAWSAAEAARRELAGLEAAAADALERSTAAEREIVHRDELVDDLRGAEAELDKLRGERERVRPDLDAAEPRAADLAGRLDEVDAQLRSAREALDAERAQLQRVQDVADLRDWRLRRARVHDALGRRDAATEVIDAVRVDATALDQIESAALRAAEARARLEVAGARVVAEVHAPVRLEVEGPAEASLVGEERSWTVTEPWSVRIDDLVTLTVQPGQDALDLGTRADDAAADLAALCRRFEVSTPEEAKAQFGLRAQAERARADAEADLRHDLGDLTLELLEARIRTLEVRLGDAVPQAPPEASEGTDDVAVSAALAGVARAEERVGALDVERAAVAADVTAAEAALERTRGELRILDARIDQADELASKLAERLGDARAVRPDDDLRTALDRSAAAADRAAAAAARAAAEVAALDPDGLRRALDEAAASVRSHDDTVERLTAERTRLVTTLEALGEQGIASQLDEARTRLAHLERERDRVDARARAAELLHETFRTRRDEARQRYAGPFRAEIERLGRIVFGEDTDIELDDDLRISRRITGGVALDHDQLSVGAREQLGLIARLACARIVNADDGAPVIFDDVLGYTDPERLRSMGRAIAAASVGCQVIILTCTPDRYAHVGEARVVSVR